MTELHEFTVSKNVFNPTSEVQNIGNGAFQNAPFANGIFANSNYSSMGIINLQKYVLTSKKKTFRCENQKMTQTLKLSSYYSTKLKQHVRSKSD